MTPYDVLQDSFGRIADGVRVLLDGLDEHELTARLGPDANTIAWLVWHLTRVQDAQVAHLSGAAQVWLEEGWVTRFALPFDERATGYGQSSEEVGQLRATTALLEGYLAATHAATLRYLAGEPDLDRVVDTRWDPPVTVGVRLVSIVDDDAKHLGQAEFVKGVLATR